MLINKFRYEANKAQKMKTQGGGKFAGKAAGGAKSGSKFDGKGGKSGGKPGAKPSKVNHEKQRNKDGKNKFNKGKAFGRPQQKKKTK